MARKLTTPLALALSALLILQIVTASNFLSAYATKNAIINDVETESSSYNLGDEAVFYVYVKNTGTEWLHARIVGNILDPDGNVVYDSHVEGEDESRNIAPGSTSSGRFEWSIPESADPGEYEIRSSVREWDDWETMYDWSDEGDFEVEDLEEPSLEDYGISSPSSNVPEDGPIHVTPGGEFRAWYWIENSNSVDIDVMLGLSIRSPSGEVISDPNDDKTCSLDPDDEAICNRFFDIPNDLEMGTYDVAFGIWDSGMDVQYEQDWANNWLEINEEYDLTLVTETADGNGIDGELEVSGMGTFDTDPSYTLKVSNGEYVIFAPEKIGDRIFKGWESGGNVDHLDIGDYTARITVEGDGKIIAIYDDPPFFTLDASPDEITGKAGEKLSTTITISSENGFDDYVELGVGWPGHLDIADHSDDKEVKVNEGGEATYEAFIILDEGEEEGTYTMSVWAESDDYSDGIDVVFNVLPSEPDEESSFELSLSPASATVVQGASKTFSIDVERIGDFDEEVRLTLDDDNADIDWEFDREEDQPPFHASLTIETSSDTEPGTYEMRVIAEGDDIEVESELILTVEEAEVIEDIEEIVDAEIESFSLNADEFVEGDVIEAIVEVENTGNTDYTFFVGFSVRNEDNGEWFDANPKSIRISPDSTRTVTLELGVVSATPLGEYEAVVALWLGENDGGSLYGELDRDENEEFSIISEGKPKSDSGSSTDGEESDQGSPADESDDSPVSKNGGDLEEDSSTIDISPELVTQINYEPQLDPDTVIVSPDAHIAFEIQEFYKELGMDYPGVLKADEFRCTLFWPFDYFCQWTVKSPGDYNLILLGSPESNWLVGEVLPFFGGEVDYVGGDWTFNLLGEDILVADLPAFLSIDNPFNSEKRVDLLIDIPANWFNYYGDLAEASRTGDTYMGSQIVSRTSSAPMSTQDLIRLIPGYACAEAYGEFSEGSSDTGDLIFDGAFCVIDVGTLVFPVGKLAATVKIAKSGVSQEIRYSTFIALVEYKQVGGSVGKYASADILARLDSAVSKLAPSGLTQKEILNVMKVFSKAGKEENIGWALLPANKPGGKELLDDMFRQIDVPSRLNHNMKVLEVANTRYTPDDILTFGSDRVQGSPDFTVRGNVIVEVKTGAQEIFPRTINQIRNHADTVLPEGGYLQYYFERTPDDAWIKLFDTVSKEKGVKIEWETLSSLEK